MRKRTYIDEDTIQIGTPTDKLAVVIVELGESHNFPCPTCLDNKAGFDERDFYFYPCDKCRDWGWHTEVVANPGTGAWNLKPWLRPKHKKSWWRRLLYKLACI